MAPGFGFVGVVGERRHTPCISSSPAAATESKNKPEPGTDFGTDVLVSTLAVSQRWNLPVPLPVPMPLGVRDARGVGTVRSGSRFEASARNVPDAVADGG